MTVAACPKIVKVGALEYKVRFDYPYLEKKDLSGESDHEALVITLNPQHPLLSQKRTMIHEVLHCCFFQSTRNFDQMFNPDQRTEENVACVLEGPLHAVLRENPELVRWLTK